ncbi:MAG: M6 family metalloprotease domain-containing protein, partial [Bacteroidaceae bacterium]|nr:M6 family metalloprotease domain-containing protein [Bacteroidaceae bacterium]
MKTSILRYAAMLVLMLSALTASAVPAKPGLTKKITLSDGSQIVARLVGDEHGHYWLGQDGNAYKSMDGDIYQRVDAQQVKQRAALRRQAADQRRLRRLAPRKVGEVGSITGQKKGLIILVNFTDVTFQSDNNKALYERIANEENFSYGDFKGSMYDYFKAQSEGQFELTFDIVGPVSVSKNQAYYGSNDSNGNDKYPAKMVIEALKLVNSQVNFANYDWDGDREVEQVYVVYAGQGEADGGASSTIWPHEYDLNSAKSYGDGSGAQTLDGMKINTYACGGELNGSNNIAGIGTMCHEFSHCLGYP